MVAQSLPMAAMFLRNKMLSWTAMFLSVQSYLSEPTNKVKDPKDTSQPPLLKLAFAAISLVTCYIDIIFPSQPTAKTAKSAAETIVSSATSILSTATN